MKTCTKCKETHSLDLFYSDSSRKDKKHPECVNCHKQRSLEYRARKKTFLNNNAMNRHYVNNYGITQDEFKQKAQQQGHQCKICSIDLSFEKRNSLDKAVMDHDHESGKLRDVLCSGCNKALGLFKDNQDILQNAIAYLKEHQN